MTARDRMTGWQGEDGSIYRDDGCSLAPSCLACPLITCRYDMAPKQAVAMVAAYRVRALLAQGLTMDAVAAQMGTHRRTVFRLKKQLRHYEQTGEWRSANGSAARINRKQRDKEMPEA